MHNDCAGNRYVHCWGRKELLIITTSILLLTLPKRVLGQDDTIVVTSLLGEWFLGTLIIFLAISSTIAVCEIASWEVRKPLGQPIKINIQNLIIFNRTKNLQGVEIETSSCQPCATGFYFCYNSRFGVQTNASGFAKTSATIASWVKTAILDQ